MEQIHPKRCRNMLRRQENGRLMQKNNEIVENVFNALKHTGHTSHSDAGFHTYTRQVDAHLSFCVPVCLSMSFPRNCFSKR